MVQKSTVSFVLPVLAGVLLVQSAVVGLSFRTDASGLKATNECHDPATRGCLIEDFSDSKFEAAV
ncbi:MAG: hypothetical protein ACTS2F_08420 [Thainema sp.]